jgi:hypothetical protein
VQGRIQNMTTTKKEKKYRTSVEMNVRIIDVSTGEIKASRDLKGLSEPRKELSARIAYAALDDMEGKIKAGLRGIFPLEGKLIKIIDAESKKNKEKVFVLISCGEEIGVAAGDRFHVYEEESIEMDGKTYQRQVSIGKLKVQRVELDGLFSVAEVVEGQKKIKAALQNETELKVASAE